jgi:glycosyltransferase involved in cell wall biosynthesis
MKVLLVTPSYKPAYVYGGPAVSVSELAEALVAVGHAVTVYTTTANGKNELEVQTGVPLSINGVTVYYFRRQTGDHTHVSLGLWQKLWATATSYDVIHLQSWWSLLILGAAAICRMKRCSYFISPRGMLSSYSFEKQHSLPKKIIHRTIGNSLLKRSRLHATTLLEWNDCMQVNQSWKGFILPNIIRFPPAVTARQSPEKQNSPLVIGFLSRIDPKKGLELLMHALSKTDFDYRLLIAGAGEEAYVASLKELSRNLGISSKIEWCGWKKGDEKFQFLQSIDVFALTSHNENFANTVIESLVMGTPVFLSHGVGLADYVKEHNLGWTCQTTVPSITENLRLMFTERHKLMAIQKFAPALIKQDFGKENLAIQYGSAYQQFA